MKIIDSKGRIFGKINVIDLFVIIGIILLIVVGVKLLLNNIEKEPESKVGWKTIQVESNNEPDYIANSISEGDLIEKNGEVIAEIVDININKIEDNNNNLLFIIKLLTQVDEQNISLYDGKELLIGDPFVIKTTKVSVKGTIVSFDSDIVKPIIKTEEKKIELLIENKEKWFVDSISIGDKVYDENNKLIAEITGKESKPSVLIVKTLEGEILVKNHPQYQDITLNLNLYVTQENNELFYDNQKLKVGNDLKINFDNIDILGIITEIG